MFSFFKRKKNKKAPTNNDPFVTDYADNTPKENTSFKEMKEKASEISDNIQESTSDMLDNARETVDKTLDNAKESIEESFDDVQEKTSDMIDNFKNNEDEDINDNVSDEDKDIVDEEELSEEFTTINNENESSPEHKFEEDIIAKDSNEEEFENENEDLGEDSEGSNELPREVSGEYVPGESKEENDPLSEDHHEEENVLESTKPEDNPEDLSVNSENNEENHEDDTSTAEEREFYDEEVATDDHPIIDEENIENGKTIPLFPGNDISVEESEIDDFINESKEVGDAKNNDDSQIMMNFNNASFEEDDESDPLDIAKIQDQENYDEKKEVRKSIAFNVQQLIDSKSYPLILAIKENDDAIKEELTSIIGKNTVFLVDFTESRNGYKIIPDSANREFAPINNEGDSSYLDGIDIINLIKNSGDKYDGSAIIIAGIDNITNKVSHTLSGNQIAIDMIYEKIKTSIQEAVENNITVIGTGYELSEPLSDFIDQLSLKDIIEEHDSSEENESIVTSEENESIVTSPEKEVEDGEENVIEHDEYNINERVDKEGDEPEEIIEEKTTENDEDNDNRNTVDEYLKSMGKSSIEEGIKGKNKDVFVEDD